MILNNMKQGFLLISGLVFFNISGITQKNSAEIGAQINSLNVVGSVLYIAAHPDDENNSFLPYLTKERNFRTAYLSLTRGDGGQNLIGKEQGIELGMIRTQELLAARRIDGAEQYFSSAYEFGFSKSFEEALKIWDHQKVLSDAVWVIRQFQPDIIIARFPPDARAGHGHHAASAIIAKEAFIAAADPAQFPEQFKFGVRPWQAKRLLWNTFNFGGNNTTSGNQLKIEVGGYNSVLGKSYGEIGAEARTMHKSQGEGRPRRRGELYEFFEMVMGEAPKEDIMDGVVTDWTRFGHPEIQLAIQKMSAAYDLKDPSKSVPALVQLYAEVENITNLVWKNYILKQISILIQEASGIYLEATTQQQQAFPGTPLKIQFLFNQRSRQTSTLEKVIFPTKDSVLQKKISYNTNVIIDYTLPINKDQPISQPYWLVHPKTEGMFVVDDYNLIGKAQNDPVFEVGVSMTIQNKPFLFKVPVQYKYVDPTKGDVYQPIAILPIQEIKYDKEVYLMNEGKPVEVSYESVQHPGLAKKIKVTMNSEAASLPTSNNSVFHKSIQYDHIPTLTYFPLATTKLMSVALKTKGSKIGYFEGAGDKLPEALIELGYQVVYLKETDLELDKLKSLDAIVVGIRAYNMYDYLSDKNEVLNKYIEQGGNVIVQYIKSNSVGINKVQAGPFSFTVNPGRRVTQEEVPVQFNLPNHPVLNFPNKITALDFDNWVQERSTYQAENIDSHFEMPFTMNDKGEAASNGSLLIAPYGKGNFVYLSLTLFRQLPAGNPGAYKLLDNLISLPKH